MSKLAFSGGIARWLGYGGLLPFIACTTLIVVRDDGALTRQVIYALIAYSAVILSFMGAIHWGRAMFSESATGSATSRDAAFVVSVVPAIVAWFATLVRIEFALILLIAAFAALYFVDRLVFADRAGLEWYLPLRIRLTSIVIGCLLITFLVFI